MLHWHPPEKSSHHKPFPIDHWHTPQDDQRRVLGMYGPPEQAEGHHKLVLQERGIIDRICWQQHCMHTKMTTLTSTPIVALITIVVTILFLPGSGTSFQFATTIQVPANLLLSFWRIYLLTVLSKSKLVVLVCTSYTISPDDRMSMSDQYGDTK